VERCGGLDSFCSKQLLVCELCDQSNECREFLHWWSFPRQPAAWLSVTDLKSSDFGCVQICKCVWLFYGEGEVGKCISMENVHSETVVWHFITSFGFCMIIVSPIINEHRDGVYFEVTVCCKNTTPCFHICIRVTVL